MLGGKNIYLLRGSSGLVVNLLFQLVFGNVFHLISQYLFSSVFFQLKL